MGLLLHVLRHTGPAFSALSVSHRRRDGESWRSTVLSGGEYCNVLHPSSTSNECKIVSFLLSTNWCATNLASIVNHIMLLV